MSGLKLFMTVDGKYNYKFLKLWPQKKLLMKAGEYAFIWSNIINMMTHPATDKQDMVVILSSNVFWLGEDEIYEEVLQKIENGQLRILADKEYADRTIRINWQETGLTEHKYVLSVKIKDSPDSQSLIERDVYAACF